MSFSATVTALQTFMKNGWATQGRSEKIVYRGYSSVTNTDPAKLNSAWVRFLTNEANGNKITLGGVNARPRFRYAGIITIDLFQRAGTGTETIEEMADACKTIFMQFAINDSSAGYIRIAPGQTPVFRFGGVFPEGWEHGIVEIAYVRDKQELN